MVLRHCCLLAALLALGAAGARDERLGPPRPVATPVAPTTTAAEPTAPTPIEPTRPAAGAFDRFPRVDGPLTVDEAVGLALEHSPVIAAAGQDVEMARQMLASARAALAPKLSATAWGSYGDGAMILGSPESVMPAATRMMPAGPAADLNFMFMWPLYTGGRLEGRRDAAASSHRASQAELAGLRQEVAYTVRTLVRRLALQRATLDVYRELVATNQEQLRIDEQSFAVGKIPQFYLLRDQAALAEARQSLVNAARDERILLADLRAVLGIHPLSDVSVPAAITEPGETPELVALLDLAASRRPELDAARHRLLGAGSEVDAARAAYQPQVGLVGMADLMANRMDRWEEYLVGVAVGLPLLDRGERRAMVGAAKAKAAMLTQQEFALALQVAREVVTAHEQLDAARQNVLTAESVLDAAREDYRIARLRYTEGKGINVEVQDALTARVRAETNHIAALFDLQVSSDALLRATGDPALFGEAEEALP